MGGCGLAWGTTAGRASGLTEPCRTRSGCASPTIHPNRAQNLLEALGRTRMRPLLVKRHTTPERGFSPVFPPGDPRPSRQSVSCSDLMSGPRCHLRVAAPHTYGGSVATGVTLAESPGGCLCARASMRGPPTVLLRRLAASLALARESRGRGRGRTRTLGRLLPPRTQPERVAKHSGGLQATRPRRPLAFTDAGTADHWGMVRRRPQSLSKHCT